MNQIFSLESKHDSFFPSHGPKDKVWQIFYQKIEVPQILSPPLSSHGIVGLAIFKFDTSVKYCKNCPPESHSVYLIKRRGKKRQGGADLKQRQIYKPLYPPTLCIPCTPWIPCILCTQCIHCIPVLPVPPVPLYPLYPYTPSTPSTSSSSATPHYPPLPPLPPLPLFTPLYPSLPPSTTFK